MENQENRLRVKLSTFKSDLSFNEWVEKYNVSRDYVEPTKYFQGNNSSGYKPLGIEEHQNPLVKLLNLN